MPSRTALSAAALAALSLAPLARAQTANTIVEVGNSGVSALMLFLGTENKVYFVDKTENNPVKINGHPAWATEMDIHTWQTRTMDIKTNTFCAGGAVMGDGQWLNVGGNQAVVEFGNAAGPPDSPAQQGQNIYGNADGRKAIRVIKPCDDEKCNWVDDAANYMDSERWYPTVEGLEDGSAMIMGGCQNGGYVNDPGQDNPTWEYFPRNGRPTVTLNVLVQTNPINLYPLIFLLPSGMMLVQSGWKAIIFDYKNNIEYPIGDIPDAVRVYPASAATTVYPMTPANNWTATVVFCGGTNLPNERWNANTETIVDIPTETSCVTITPDVSLQWEHTDALDSGRTMGQFINLPDGRLYLVNGAGKGTAGYGNNSWAIGQSYADNPQSQSWYMDPSQPAGKRWSKAATSDIPRMYHSAATLLPDGSVMIAGSNPNADYVDGNNPIHVPNDNYKYFTETRVEVFYPDYYDKARPAPQNLPKTITYGGDQFDVQLTKADLGGKTANIARTKAVLIRTGFSTHCMNMGQRHVELQTSFSTDDMGGATLHVAQMPPNPAILAPGSALLFIVVDGVPSNGTWVMVGDGKVGEQHTILPQTNLPQPQWSADVAAEAQSLNIQRRDVFVGN